MGQTKKDEFEAGLLERGLMPGTIAVYLRDLELASWSRGGLLERLRDEHLAPKTKRHILAAARHWADFAADADLTQALKKLRLPPARRKKARIPISRENLLALVDEIDRATYIDAPIRWVIGLMATRGFRVGDVLRMTRKQVDHALESATLSYLGKGRRYLQFKVIKNYRKYLQALAKEDDGAWERVDELVAPGAGEAGRRKAAAHAVERALTKIGVHAGVLGLYPHRLRRTYATEYLRQLKGDPEAVIKLQQHMQWASVATALEYVDHARGDELDAVAEKIFER